MNRIEPCHTTIFIEENIWSQVCPLSGKFWTHTKEAIYRELETEGHLMLEEEAMVLLDLRPMNELCPKIFLNKYDMV